MIRSIASAAALALACAGTAAAQAAGQPVPPPVPQSPAVRPAPRLQTQAVSLDEAVRSTLQNDPTLAAEQQNIDVLMGREQQTSGTFDALLTVGPSAGFMQQELASGLLGSARGLRDTLAEISTNFTQLTGVMQSIVRSSVIVPPRCPSNLVIAFGGVSFNNAFLQQPINVDRIDPAEQTLLGTKTFLNGTTAGDILGNVTLGSICSDPRIIGLAPQNYLQVFRDLTTRNLIDYSGGQGLNAFLTSVSQIEPESRLLQLQISDSVAVKARLALERLGPVPVDDLQRTTGFDFNIGKPFRNGWNLATDVNLASFDHNYKDKPYDPTFGGLGQPPQFQSQLSVSLGIPLGRGYGYTAVGAPERSARMLVVAERDTLRQTAAEQAFRTSLAYLNAIASRDTLAELEQSAVRQQRIVDLTNQAVQVGDIAAVETNRARARAARVEGSIIAARAALTAARVSLAEAMGIDADSMAGIPTVAENFASASATLPAADALIARAMSLRRDVRARTQRQAASETLAMGARANLRRRFDFNLNAGLTNIYSSPIYHYLPDEQNTVIPVVTSSPEQALTYYSPLGYYRTFSKRYEPFALAQFQVELPFGNHGARGRLQQAEATLTNTRIDSADLARSIHDNVVDLTGQIRQAAAAVDRWQAAVRADDEAVQGVLQRFEIREVTLIDTLITEENATQDRLQLVAARQQYLSLLARLRFETGELLTFDTEGQSITDYKFDPTFLVGR